MYLVAKRFEARYLETEGKLPQALALCREIIAHFAPEPAREDLLTGLSQGERADHQAGRPARRRRISAACSRAMMLVKQDPTNRGPIEMADLFSRHSRRKVEALSRRVFDNDDDMTYRVAQGVMKGEHLAGRYVLVRFRRAGKDEWLLFRAKD